MKRNLAGIVVFLAFAQFSVGRPPTGQTRGLKEKRVNLTHPDDGYYADHAKAFNMRIKRFGLEGRIVGGREAEPGEAPYQLGLFSRYVCGATLVKIKSVQFGVTAAHCVVNIKTNEPIPPYEFYVRGGNINKYAGQYLALKNVVVHEGYQGKGNHFHDIALLFFKGQFRIWSDLQPVSLPDEHTVDEELQELIVSGWGATRELGHGATNLQILTVPVVASKECREIYSKFQNNPEYLDASICAGFPEGGKDSCQGDSGGPAVAVDERGKYLAGVVSWGLGCARPGFPGVYTKVSRHIDWIHTHVSAEKTV